jgi:TorA maturation chaperone TorD
MSPKSPQPETALEPEERARGDIYALLSRLFAAPADAELLHSIATGGQTAELQDEANAGEFARTLRALAATAAGAREAAVSEEYHAMFIGTGRPEISLYVGAYAQRSSVDRSLVALRSFLASHGLQRQTGVHEPEDHFAMLLEIMRFLICEERSAIEDQKQFFEQFIWPASLSLCDAISEHATAHFYRSAANFAKAFLSVEQDAFGM